MNELKEQIRIEDMIYVVRGKEVMLDRDLANLYHVETRTLIQKMKRNIERFPKSFCFQLSNDEFLFWKSQNVISKNDQIGLRRPPFAFTEQGVAMLSAIIKSDVAITTSIKIMNAFVNMKKYISNNMIEQKYINNLVLEDHNRINLLEETFDKLNEKQKVNTIFYQGQIFDAYVVLKEILSKAKKEIIIIDDYAGYKLFDILKTIDRKILIITSNIEEVDYEKYESQYHNIKIKKSNIFHDRFIIIDGKILYHSGASFKDLGKRCFAINLIEDKNIIKEIIKMIGE